MALQGQGSLPVRTQAPSGFTNLDFVVGVVATNGTDALAIDNTGRVTVKIQDSSGDTLDSTGGSLHINIATQSLAAVKVSKDANANAVGNPLFSQLSDGTNAIGLSFPLHTQIVVGGAVKGSEAAPFFIEIAEGGAALGAANALAVRLTDGDAFNDQANPVFAAVSKNTTINSVTNPIAIQLSDGTAAAGTLGNPIYIIDANAEAGGTPQKDYEQSTGGAIVKNGGTRNYDFAVPTGETLRLLKILCAAHAHMHFDVIDDATGAEGGPTTIVSLYTSPGSPQAVYEFELAEEFIGGAGGTTMRVRATNDDAKDSDASVYWEGTLD